MGDVMGIFFFEEDSSRVRRGQNQVKRGVRFRGGEHTEQRAWT
jgi:hypothetical protein